MKPGNAYATRLQATLDRLVRCLATKGIVTRHLSFGGEGQESGRKPAVPTDARSEFLANRAMGDWAENRLSAALGQALPEWKVIQYGTTDRIAAGHPDFKKRYLAGLEETRRFGKRPDLLLFPTTDSIPTNLYERDHAGSEGFVKRAIAAVEVRSSKFEAHTGFPTRLLDWTRNPLVAAFFAVEHPGDHDRAVWVHHAEIPMLTFDLDGLARHITWMRLRHREG